MPPDQETAPNPPTPDSSPTQASNTPETTPEPPNAPTDGSTPESQNTPVDTGNAETAQPQNQPETTSNQDSPSSTTQTAQTPVNEPLTLEPKPIQVSQSKASLARELLITARNAIQFRKQKKLDKVMSLFLKQSKITNDEVEKFLHVSDATATRYLSQLEKEGKIKQNGKTGKGVSYSRI